MDIVLLLAVASLSNIACFVIGAKLGQTVSEGKSVRTSIASPMEAYREHKQKKEAEAEKSRYDIIMRNIDKYDGTGNGQEDVG